MAEEYLTGVVWIHKKTGGEYYIESFTTREEDMITLVNYYKAGGGKNNPVWTRPAHEFFDGRFLRFIPELRTSE